MKKYIIFLSMILLYSCSNPASVSNYSWEDGYYEGDIASGTIYDDAIHIFRVQGQVLPWWGQNDGIPIINNSFEFSDTLPPDFICYVYVEWNSQIAQWEGTIWETWGEETYETAFTMTLQ